MITNGINSLGLYGLNQNQSLTGLGSYGNLSSAFPGTSNIFGSTSPYGATSGMGSMFSSLFGGQANALGGTAAATDQSNLYSIENMNKAVDVNGDGTISQEEITAFLQDPMAALQKAAASKTGASDTNSMMTNILTMLQQLLTGQNATQQTAQGAQKTAQAAQQTSQGNTADINSLKQQLQAATTKSDNLKKELETQKTDILEASDAAKKALTDAKAATAKADASAKAIVDYKNSHGDEDPKLFAKEFGQLLDENKNNAISRQEFQKIAVAAGDDLKVNKEEWDSLVDASKLADANKADLKAQVAANDEIDVKGLEENLFEHDKDGDGSVEAGAEINSFATDVASNDGNDGAVNTGDLAAESFEIPAEDPPAEPAAE